MSVLTARNTLVQQCSLNSVGVSFALIPEEEGNGRLRSTGRAALSSSKGKCGPPFCRRVPLDDEPFDVKSHGTFLAQTELPLVCTWSSNRSAG